MIEPIHIISLGAGVQSSTMALMAAHGEITPMPKCAIFADTQDEPESVYRWLKKLIPLLPFPVHTVSRGKLSEVLLHNVSLGKGVGRFIAIPSYGDRGGMGRRQCTREFKVDCINRKIREFKNGQKRVNLWIGISLDEVGRMKPNRIKYINNLWPLIDKRMTRWDCLRWLKAKGYDEPPKSACVFCPYHSSSVWRELKRANGTDWAHAVEVDRQLNKRGEYVHRSLKPLSEIDFSTDEDRGQQVMFGNECDGVCGI
jgi:hypothetical protein